LMPAPDCGHDARQAREESSILLPDSEVYYRGERNW
jgi:hypothetical protein